jgi:hypothetical protein
MKLRVLAPLIGLAVLALLGIGWTVFANATPAQQLTNYQNDLWHFSINVPSNMTVDHVENVGTEEQVIQFSDASAEHIFEISAAPYSQMDVALGEEGTPNDSDDQPTTLGIVNVYHDNTFNVGFHHKGIAYSVTAVSGADPWLIPILQSWEFTN